MYFIKQITSFICFLLINNVATSTKRPHIFVIIADDVGWNDFGIHGSNQIPTPNIDALGCNGVVLNRFYTQHICTPSRAAFLTGKYPIKSGMQGRPIRVGEKTTIPASITLLSERLKKLDYATHLVGKWHLGAASRNYTPTYRGFDNHFGYLNGYAGYFNYFTQALHADKSYRGFDLRHDLQPDWSDYGQYSTDLFSNKTLEIIDNHNQSKPLFLMMAHMAAHVGDNATELGVPNITATEEKYSYIGQAERRKTADIINIMDDSIGKLVDKLSKTGMLENSIIIFFSDNGAPTIGEGPNYSSGWPLRGMKFTLFEGGLRGSCVVYSPLLKKKGYINNELIHITDLMPTLYHAAGGNVSDLGEIDGINQWDVISKNDSTKRTEILLNIDEVENQSGILGYNGRYKLLNGTYQKGIFDFYFGESGRGNETPSYNMKQTIQSLANKAIQKLPDHKNLTEEIIKKTRKQLDLNGCRNNSTSTVEICDGFCLFDIFNDPCETKNIINETDKKLIISDLKEKLGVFWTELIPQNLQPFDVKSDPLLCNHTWFPWLDGSKGCIL